MAAPNAKARPLRRWRQGFGICPLAALALVGVACLLAAGTSLCEETPALPFVKGSTTLVVLPDTEGYPRKRPHIFNAMMKWVADNREPRNITYLLHVGDITNNNTRSEWKNARKAFDFIEGKVPYVLAAGNHDYDHTPGRLTYMNEFFRVEDLKKWKTFGDVYEPGKLENHYQFTEIHGRKWIVLSLETGPRRAVIDWANKVLATHKDRLAIILTHAYLYYNNKRYNHLRGGQRASPYKFYGDGADGEMLWNQLVRRHRNVMMVVCGHLSSAYVGYRVDEGDYGNQVHQMLVDYEKMSGGGMGFLRLLEFLPDKKTVQVRTYSPVTGKTNPKNPKLEEFTFTLQTATRDTPKPGSEPPPTIPDPPIHRYSFDGTGGDGAVLTDSVGKVHGKVHTPEGKARLNGKGQLVIDDSGSAHGVLDARLVEGRQKASFEVWFTPTAKGYKWDAPLSFRGGGGNAFYYTFRTLTKHRAELIVNGHNEDIQRDVAVKVGRPMHVVVTYDQAGLDGRPLLSSFVNGKQTGAMKTSIKLSVLKLTRGRVGPFAGAFDEIRIYDYALNAQQVATSFKTGPDKLAAPKK